MSNVLVVDADGMLVHGERFSERLEREYGIPLERTAPFFDGAFQRCLVGDADLKEELSRTLAAWRWTGSVDALLSVWFDPLRNIIDERFQPAIQRLRAKGVVVYLATNNEQYRTNDLVHVRGLGQWFDGVYASAYLGAVKPEPRFFQRMIEAIGHPTERIALWDDDPKNIEGALAFGLRARLYESFEQFASDTCCGIL